MELSKPEMDRAEKMSRVYSALLALCIVEELTPIEVGSIAAKLYIQVIRGFGLGEKVACEAITALWRNAEAVPPASHPVAPVSGSN